MFTDSERTSDGGAVKVVPINKSLPDDRVPPALTNPMTQFSEGFHAEDSVQDRITLKNWDPVS